MRAGGIVRIRGRMQSGKSWLEISEGRLRQNYRALVDAAAVGGGSIPVLAVVKANAYGHGAELCAPVLAAAGAPWLGVADAEEGARVRRAVAGVVGAEPRVLVMNGSLPADAAAIAGNGLTAVAWTPEQMRSLSEAGAGEVHVEIDTGMSRQGVAPGAALDGLLEAMAGLRGVWLGGVMTHFASAEVAGSGLTALQRERFGVAMEQVAGRGLRPEWVHVGNTSTVDEGGGLPWLLELAGRYGARPMVRSGLALYGYCLPLKGGTGRLRGRLEPVLRWRCRVLAVEDVEAGATVGYNATFTTAERMRLALLPVGYADGLRREVSSANAKGGGWVMVRGRRAPVVGRISMNLTTVDVTAIPEVEVGDEVTLLGEGVSAEEHAGLAGTIAYEILCGLRAPARLTA
jgi:alanine racemase